MCNVYAWPLHCVSNPLLPYTQQRTYANDPTLTCWHFNLFRLLLADFVLEVLQRFVMSEFCNKHGFILDCVQEWKRVWFQTERNRQLLRCSKFYGLNGNRCSLDFIMSLLNPAHTFVQLQIFLWVTLILSSMPLQVKWCLPFGVSDSKFVHIFGFAQFFIFVFLTLRV
jgi:hypothetical protein